MLQQGSEIEPKYEPFDFNFDYVKFYKSFLFSKIRAASIRLAASVWWFFTLILVSSYTANLAAFLTVENNVAKITSVQAFEECVTTMDVKCPVEFGAKEGGATLSFFQVYFFHF